MARPEVTGRKLGDISAGNASNFSARGPPPTIPLLAMSITQFCLAHNISEAMYHKMKQQGLGPREMEVGARRLISLEAAAEWRREREEREKRKEGEEEPPDAASSLGPRVPRAPGPRCCPVGSSATYPTIKGQSERSLLGDKPMKHFRETTPPVPQRPSPGGALPTKS
jgi:hypothetical protein